MLIMLIMPKIPIMPIILEIPKIPIINFAKVSNFGKVYTAKEIQIANGNIGTVKR
jgi:hypothetical protein